MTTNRLIEHRRRVLVRAWIRYCENPKAWAFWLAERAEKLAAADGRSIFGNLQIARAPIRRRGGR